MPSALLAGSKHRIVVIISFLGLFAHFFESSCSLQDMGTCYARLYDTSRSEADKIGELVSLLLVDWDGVSLDLIQQLLVLAAGQKPQSWKTADAVRETLKMILGALGCVV